MRLTIGPAILTLRESLFFAFRFLELLSGGSMADNKADKKADSKTKAMTKSAVVQHLATETKLSKKQVSDVFEKLTALIKKELGKKGPGVFTLPGLLKLKRVMKKATPARQGVHPITKQPMTFKAKPARSAVKARALKTLNDQIK